jgi:hypothetical protein
VYSVFCEGTKIAWLGAKEYLSAGMALTRFIIDFSGPSSSAFSASAGATCVPGAIIGPPPPICARAPVAQQAVDKESSTDNINFRFIVIS